MIKPQGNMKMLSHEIRFFDLLQDHRCDDDILEMFDHFKMRLPANVKMSINFFKEGDFVHGEALLSYGGKYVVARKMGSSAIAVAFLLLDEIKKRSLSLVVKH